MAGERRVKRSRHTLNKEEKEGETIKLFFAEFKFFLFPSERRLPDSRACDFSPQAETAYDDKLLANYQSVTEGAATESAAAEKKKRKTCLHF